MNPNGAFVIIAVVMVALYLRLGAKQLRRDTRRMRQPQRYRHLKSGGVYEVIETARLENNCARVVVYRNVESREVWVRDYNEFFDGRFEAIPTSK